MGCAVMSGSFAACLQLLVMLSRGCPDCDMPNRHEIVCAHHFIQFPTRLALVQGGNYPAEGTFLSYPTTLMLWQLLPTICSCT
jgi:hypothetical protein